MKVKVTRSKIMASYRTVCHAPDTQGIRHLLSLLDPVAYNAGGDGWNYDVYDLQPLTGYSIAICDGYRHLPGVEIPEEAARKADEAARGIDCHLADSDRRQVLAGILDALAQAIGE